ncbi:hypothetical protein J1614_003406 [Plenodomus biglobosus]|nr:hypothetical protein J1614_003406 [Plenodomus biglobosus]
MLPPSPPPYPTPPPLPPTHSPKTHLITLLTQKLHALPPHHIPTPTLRDILLRRPRATHLPNLPPDLQLAFFLRHRAQMAQDGDQARKSAEQSMDVTPAIWYYRVDSARQFQRWHDGVRWNLGMFVALLALGEIYGEGYEEGYEEGWGGEYGNRQGRSHREGHGHGQSHQRFDPLPPPLSPPAKTFIKQYLHAVLEHHTTPTLFRARERFLHTWKTSRYDMFVLTRASHKQALKQALKRLRSEWERVLDREIARLGRAEYERGVGRWVGCVVPGRRDQCVGGRVLGGGFGLEGKGEEDGEEEEEEEMEIDIDMENEKEDPNPLLSALLVPFPFPPAAPAPPLQDEETSTVTDIRTAIAAVKNMGPRDILPVLKGMLAEGGEA